MEQRGLYNKYNVTHAESGQPVDGATFILRPDRDPAAIAALRAYAKATDNEALRADIIKWVGSPDLELSDYQKGLLRDYVERTEFSYPEGNKTVLCTITMKRHGFQITGKAGCVDPSKYVQTLGEHYSLVEALNKLDEHLGYERQLRLAGILK